MTAMRSRDQNQVPSSVEATINGERAWVNQGITLATLLSLHQVEGQRVAVERNGRIVPRSLWNETTIYDGDRIEIVQFVGGG
jgi:sulfur carrier protein